MGDRVAIGSGDGTGARPAENAEERRLASSNDRTSHWKKWGPYLSERAWGTVREDYSPEGTPWEYFPHDHARSRAYRWNEDGIAGISDRRQRICFALSLWNGRDAILKSRLFGLSGHEGNHGEDVKELYWYLDSTPTHSYMRMLYKYPQAAFPYAQLLQENRRRGHGEPEYELLDTGVFDEDRYFDVFVEYAKAGVDDIVIRVQVVNRGPEEAPLDLLPTIWFRNTWSWGGAVERPEMHVDGHAIALRDPERGRYWLLPEGDPELLFTENETNHARLHGTSNRTRYAKDAFDDYVTRGKTNAVNPEKKGTMAAARYRWSVPPGGSKSVTLRLRDQLLGASALDEASDVLAARKSEADEFYATVIPQELSDDARSVMRQSLGGLLWSKQFYHYIVRDWIRGDASQPPPPATRTEGRNHEWSHLYNADIISMPDKWEYPWYAAWDLAFHCVPLALVDAEFAKAQLILLLREWYMHPSGQMPAYEWALGDTNPPVHAWAAWRVYKNREEAKGVRGSGLPREGLSQAHAQLHLVGEPEGRRG